MLARRFSRRRLGENQVSECSMARSNTDLRYSLCVLVGNQLGLHHGELRDTPSQAWLGHHIDLVVVLDKGIVTLSASNAVSTAGRLFFLKGRAVQPGRGATLELHKLTLVSIASMHSSIPLSASDFLSDKVPHPGFNWSSFPGAMP